MNGMLDIKLSLEKSCFSYSELVDLSSHHHFLTNHADRVQNTQKPTQTHNKTISVMFESIQASFAISLQPLSFQK